MRRPEMADRGLVIVVFDGLVGEFIRPILSDSSQSVLYMRAGALSFLRTVAKTSQLVLMLMSVRRRRYKSGLDVEEELLKTKSKISLMPRYQKRCVLA